MNQKLKDEATDRLFEAILSLRSVMKPMLFLKIYAPSRN
jgi:hypothetical protein